MSSISTSFTDPSDFSSGTPDAFGQLSSEEFTKVIFTELQNQDPLEPNDTGALLEQLSTLRSIQSDTEFADRMGSLVRQNELGSASALIGRFVSGVGEEGAGRTAGVVFSVSQTREGAVLNLDNGARVPMRNVDEVFDMEEFEGATGAASETGDAGDAGDGNDAGEQKEEES